MIQNGISFSIPLKLCIPMPNRLSVIWILLCGKMLFWKIGFISDFFFYATVVFSLYIEIIQMLRRKSVQKERKRIILLFSLLIIIQLLGLLLIETVSLFSIKNIIGTMAVLCFIDVVGFGSYRIQLFYFRNIYYLTMSFWIYQSQLGTNLGNTLPACILFLSMGYLAIEFSVSEYRSSCLRGRFIVTRVLAALLMLALIFTKVNARTALFVMIIICFSATVFYFSKMMKQYQIAATSFLLIIVSLLILCIGYANIKDFSWYDEVNLYSQLYFNKNIDSSRPFLWKTSYDSLSIYQTVLGAGTGKLPDIPHYSNSSFHNSYLQLLMQNGIVGLCIFVLIFWHIWKLIASSSYYGSQRLILGIFVGVLIYNCFETTLLQNKTFLGILQWFPLCIGMKQSWKLADEL